MTTTAVDLCAGAGGASKGAKDVGMEVLGIELDHDACETRRKAGLATLEADITKLEPHTFGWAKGLMGSPPCPSFSRAGKIRGRDEQLCEQAILRISRGERYEWVISELMQQCEDPASILVAEMLRWALRLRPDWIALEQVPPVIRLWEKIGAQLVIEGYHVWTGVLNAADYGVPQIRKRAILLASRKQEVAPPAPTHAKGGANGLLPWVSMAEGIGWGFTTRPAPTVTATSKGGPRAFDGGSGARAAVLKAIEEGTWQNFPDDRQVSRTGAVRASVAEVGLAQTFPADWPWTGRIQAIQHRQVGNAVPPMLARAYLAQFA